MGEKKKRRPKNGYVPVFVPGKGWRMHWRPNARHANPKSRAERQNHKLKMERLYGRRTMKPNAAECSHPGCTRIISPRASLCEHHSPKTAPPSVVILRKGKSPA